MVTFEYKPSQQKETTKFVYYSQTRYLHGVCFYESVDCDQSAVDLYKSIPMANSHIESGVGTPIGVGRLKDSRQQSTKVEKLENIVSELFRT